MIKIVSNDFKIENIGLVIFDKDGTFIDIHTYWGRVVELRAKKIIEKYLLPQKMFEPLCSVMGFDIQTKILPPDSPVGLYSRNKVQEILLNFLINNGIKATLKEIEDIFKIVGNEFLKEQEEYTKVIPAAVKLMEKIKKAGGKMVVITSDSKDNANHTIVKNGLSKYFDYVYGAEDSQTPKTSGEIVKTVLLNTDISYENTVCIGDTYDDFLMAQNSNIRCINVSTGVVTKKQHLKYNKLCVNSLKEIDIIKL